MLAEIFLSAGTDRVTIRDIPKHIADAIHPELPAETPRQVLGIKKFPLLPELAIYWCGQGVEPFEVSLTEADFDALAKGVWASLPEPRFPIDVGDWEPYQVAFDSSPSVEWRMVVSTTDPKTRQWIFHAETIKTYTKLVRSAAYRNELSPRDSTTLAPAANAVGEYLHSCFVTLKNFTEFANANDIGVVVEAMKLPTFTRRARVSFIDSELSRLPRDARIVLQDSIGTFKGNAICSAGEYLEVLEAAIKRQGEGFFTVGEAAQIFNEHRPEIDIAKMVARLRDAAIDGRRLVRNSGDRLPASPGSTFREFLDLVCVSDLNDWLDEQRAGYRFPEPEQAATPKVTELKPDPERRLELLRALGGSAKYSRGEWKFKGMKLLVDSERASKSKRCDEKTIRADLREAATAEVDKKRAGAFDGLGQR